MNSSAKRAFLFSGQGAQKIGMLDEIQELALYPDLMQEAKEVVGADFFRVLSQGEASWINKTCNAQLALFLHGYIWSKYLLDASVEAPYMTGLSLGEYTALASAQKMSFSDALQVVKTRGSLMSAVVSGQNASMFALMNIEQSVVAEVLAEWNDKAERQPLNKVYISNLNCPGQIVISGEKVALEEVVEQLKLRGLSRCIELAVEGAFHTPYLSEAATAFKPLLDTVDFQDSKTIVLSNVDALNHTSADLATILVRQMCETVKFELCLRRLIEAGVTEFVEIGMGKVLAGFVKKIDRKLVVKNISCLAEAKAYLVN